MREAIAVVAKAEHIGTSYALDHYGEREIYALAMLYNRQREFDTELARENW